jgi:hypothetical protein
MRLLEFIAFGAGHSLEFFWVVGFQIHHRQRMGAVAETHVRVVAFGLRSVRKGALTHCLRAPGCSGSFSRKHKGAEQQYNERFHEKQAKTVKNQVLNTGLFTQLAWGLLLPQVRRLAL